MVGRRETGMVKDKGGDKESHGQVPSHATPAGDAQAREWLDGLMRSHGAKLGGFFRFKTRDAAAAEDLVIETFCRAWQGYESFRGEAKASTWLWTIARRTLAAYYEQNRRRAPEVLVETLPESGRCQDVSAASERREALAACMESLSERARQTCELVWLLGYSYVEAATLLEESADAVRMRLKRVRLPLQQCLEEKGVLCTDT